MTTTPDPLDVTCWRHGLGHREYVCRCDPPVVGDTGREDDKPPALSSHHSCAHCSHVADEHGAKGECRCFAGNSARPCPCPGWAARTP